MIVEDAKKEEIIEDPLNNKDSKKEVSKKNPKSTKKKNSKSTKKTNLNSDKIESVASDEKENLDIAIEKDVESDKENSSVSTIEDVLESDEKDDLVTDEKEVLESDEKNDSTDTKKKNLSSNEVDDLEPDSKSKHSHNLLAISGIFLCVFLLLLITIFAIFSVYNYLNSSTIAKGVYIHGIDVSRLTKAEAKEKIDKYFSDLISNDITLVHNDYTTYVKTSEINFSLQLDSAVDYAYQIGKNSNIFSNNLQTFEALLNGVNVTPPVSYDKKFLEAIIVSLSPELPDAVEDSNYYIEDKNLIITKGHSGNSINVAETCEIIDKKLKDLSYLNEAIELKTEIREPKAADLNQIHSEIYKEAKDAYFTTDPYMVSPSSTGIDFNVSMEEASNILASAETECTIPLKVLYPKVTTNMIGQEAFPDKLSSFSTKYAASNIPRTTNLRLAANKINGYVLLPGETFSYNTVVGARTISAGYKEAAIYQNGEVVQGLGGGICQISTTLYNAVLFANLEIVELYNHQFVPSYISAGRDATVVYGAKDFKFKNTRNYPIKINCSVSGGVASFEIKGLKQENEYDVSVYANVTSRTASYIKSSTYRTLKQNGAVVKTEHITNSTYKVH